MRYLRGIKRYGRSFNNHNTGSTITGIFKSDGPCQFLPGSNISKGQILTDSLTNLTYIVAAIQARPECLYVNLFEFSMTATVQRPGVRNPDAFGCSTAEPMTICNNMPIVVRGRSAVVPRSVSIFQGDSLTLSTGDSFAVHAVRGSDWPGLLLLTIQQADANSLAAASVT